MASRNALPVVISGESGTGKELFAQAIHGASARAAGPFVAVNCGSIPAPLLEAELFGYEAGAFTGGRKDGNAGKFEEASGGTLFLDEVSELSPQGQTALLRVLQEREIVRLGGSTPRKVDVRIVAATNRELRAEVAARRFRQDLYYRLDVLSLAIPPLRQRVEDIPLLAQAFLEQAEAEVGRTGLRLSDEAVAALQGFTWPGNVRQLQNVILRAAAMASGNEILASHLPAEISRAVRTALPRPAAPAGDGPERQALGARLERHAWNVARAAEELGVSRMTLYRGCSGSGSSDRAPDRARAPSYRSRPAPPSPSASFSARYSSSPKTRERVRKRTPSPFSSENIPPRPGTTSMTSWVWRQYSNWAAPMKKRHPPISPMQPVGVAGDEVALGVAHGGAAVAAAPRLVEDERPVPLPQPGHEGEGALGGHDAGRRGRHGGGRLEEAQRLGRVGHEQVLGLLVVREHHLVVLAADARALVAAEGGVGRVEVVAVGPDAAGLDAAPHPVGGVAVAGPDAGAEPVERVVGDVERLGLVLERGHRHDRTEDLLLEDPHLVVPLEDGGLHVVAAGQVAAEQRCARRR